MKKNQVTISPAQLSRIYNKLKGFEESGFAIKIGKKSISHFIVASATIANDKSDSKEIRTKRRILNIVGDFTSNPATLQGSIRLKNNLHYKDDEYSLLHSKLDKLVKEYVATASISKKETTDCEKVSDCVKLVNIKTT